MNKYIEHIINNFINKKHNITQNEFHEFYIWLNNEDEEKLKKKDNKTYLLSPKVFCHNCGEKVQITTCQGQISAEKECSFPTADFQVEIEVKSGAILPIEYFHQIDQYIKDKENISNSNSLKEDFDKIKSFAKNNIFYPRFFDVTADLYINKEEDEILLIQSSSNKEHDISIIKHKHLDKYGTFFIDYDIAKNIINGFALLDPDFDFVINENDIINVKKGTYICTLKEYTHKNRLNDYNKHIVVGSIKLK